MKFKEILISKIKIDDRARTDKSIDDSFLKSISEKGVIQPITVMEIDDVEFSHQLVAGERRLTASRMLGLEKIPAVIRSISDEIDYKEIELFENLHREKLNWADEARLIAEISSMFEKKYSRQWGWSKDKEAEMMGKSRPLISRKLEMARALEIIPELAECKTEDEALKKFKKIRNDVLIEDLREKQEIEINKGNLTRVKYASNHYRIGDALEGLDELSEIYRNTRSSIVCFEVDPPYGVDLHTNKKHYFESSKHEINRYTEVDGDKYPEFLRRLTDKIFKVGSRDCWVLFWCGWTWFCEAKLALIEAGFMVDNIPAIWVKGVEDSEGSGQTNNPEIFLARTHECFLIARKGNPSIKKKGRSSVFNFQTVPPGDKYHPTERPVPLMTEILDTFVYPGQLVCSPFLGSGSVLRACYKLGINGFGWDLDEMNKNNFLLKVEEDWKDEK